MTSIRQLKPPKGYQTINNKASVLDHITADYLKYTSPFMLYWFYGSWLPDSMHSVLLGPVKDTSGKIKSLDNCWSRALARILSKVLDIIMLDRIIEFISSTDNRFVCKAKHGAGFCIDALKGTVKKK